MDPSLFHPKPKPALQTPPLAEGAPAVNGHHLDSKCDDDTDPSSLSLSPLTNDKDHECYDSTAFFVKEGLTGESKEMLFFGDVESGQLCSRLVGSTCVRTGVLTGMSVGLADSISKRRLNYNVWKAAAPKIVAGRLSAIFLECSYPVSAGARSAHLVCSLC